MSRKIQKLNRILSLLTSSKKSLLYSGFVDYFNLGDEAIWEATKIQFSPFDLLYAPLINNSITKQIVESKKYQLGILGGGTLIGDNLKDGTNPFRQQFESVVHRCSNYIVLGTGVGPVSSIKKQNLWLNDWKRILENCSYIGVRGPESIKSLENIGIQAEIFGDPACLLSQNAGYWSPKNNVIGVNIRPISIDSEFNVIEEIQNFLLNQIKQGFQIEFFIVSPSDIPINKQIAKNLNLEGAKFHYFYKSAFNYLSAVKSVNAFIGFRLHSVILSMCAGVPSIMIEYDRKCYDFMKSINMENLNINVNFVQQEKLQNLLDYILSKQDIISLNITKNMNKFRDQQIQKIQEIKSRFLS